MLSAAVEKRSAVAKAEGSLGALQGSRSSDSLCSEMMRSSGSFSACSFSHCAAEVSQRVVLSLVLNMEHPCG